MTKSFDCIVLGVGGFGSSTLYHLARAGVTVLGLDRFPVPHDRGSSHGETRIIRKAYFEHPDYVPLLLRSYQLWEQLERESGRDLLHQIGLLLNGPTDGECIAGCRLAARLHKLTVEEFTLDEARRRFPGFRFPEDSAVIVEPDAGYLRVEDGVRTFAERAVAQGATLRTEEEVRSWSSDGRRVRVTTDRGEYEAGHLVVTAGAWAGPLLADLSLPLEVVRKVVTWHRVNSNEYDVAAGTPAYYFELADGHFYGFPSLDNRTLKVAEHTGGQQVADPLTVDRSLRLEDQQRIGRFLRRHLPRVEPTAERHSVCLYTLTPDQHFIVDRHPAWPNVLFGAGFSGHGFKFTPVIGETLCELVTKGGTRHPVEFLSLARPGLRP